MDTMMTIGQVAKKAGVHIQTVRYYERRNILAPSRRKKPTFTIDHPGYRLYKEDTIKKLQFIKNAQELGFTLKEIGGLLRLRISNRSRCEDVKRRAVNKLNDVENKIQRLVKMKNVLKGLIQSCRKKATTNECPILKSFKDKRR